MIRPLKLARASEKGLTLVELVSVSAILIALASLTIPVANTMLKRKKELELRQSLREVREAIDKFQFDATKGPFAGQITTKHINASNADKFPEELEWLYEGLDVGDAAGTKVKYLRRLPRDPMTGKAEWDTRSSQDGPEALFTDGINIFDVRSTSERVGLNGVPYNEW